MEYWIKQNKDSSDIVALYTNIYTFDKIAQTKHGKCFFVHSNKHCDKLPSEFYVPKEYANWEFATGGYTDHGNEEEEAILTIGSYCCDGDGFVSVELLMNGEIRLLNQGDYMLDLSSNLDIAMQQAAEYLKEQYPEIHEMWLSSEV
jgi:hypothetical protein